MRSLLGQKILLSLLGMVAFGCCYTPRQQLRILREITGIWKNVDNKKISSQVDSLYRSKLIKRKNNKDGTITLILTDKGKMKAITYKFTEMKLSRENKQNWDHKWHVVFFDIPEKYRFARDILREKLKRIGFCELQKSVFAFPYECENQIDFIIETYGIRKWARFAVLEKIDNDAYLRKFFEL